MAAGVGAGGPLGVTLHVTTSVAHSKATTVMGGKQGQVGEGGARGAGTKPPPNKNGHFVNTCYAAYAGEVLKTSQSSSSEDTASHDCVARIRQNFQVRSAGVWQRGS